MGSTCIICRSATARFRTHPRSAGSGPAMSTRWAAAPTATARGSTSTRHLRYHRQGRGARPVSHGRIGSGSRGRATNACSASTIFPITRPGSFRSRATIPPIASTAIPNSIRRQNFDIALPAHPRLAARAALRAQHRRHHAERRAGVQRARRSRPRRGRARDAGPLPRPSAARRRLSLSQSIELHRRQAGRRTAIRGWSATRSTASASTAAIGTAASSPPPISTLAMA